MDGFSIGRLSVHRPSKSADSIPCISQHRPSISDDASLSDAASKKSTKSALSWLPPMTWRRPHSPPVIIRSRRELHDISTPLPPVLSTSLPSSSDLPSHRQGRTLGAFERRMAASIKEASGPGTVSGLSRRRASSASHDNLRHGAAEAYSDPLAPLPLPPKAGPAKMSGVVDERSPTPPAERPDVKWTANVQQLIQETERAFEAVGNSVSEAHLTSWLLDVIEPAAPLPIVLSHLSASEQSPPSSTSEQSPPPSNQDRRNKEGLSEKRPLVRKKSQRRKRGRKAGHDVFGSGRFQAKTIPWTLAETVSSALSQRFKRVVADEMLTPDRMEELKRGREEALKAEARLLCEGRSSTESNRSTFTDLSDQSVGPFHLESLALNMDTEADACPPAAAPQAAAAIIDEDVVRTDFQAPKDDAPQNDDADETGAITIGDFSFPSPPSKNNSRPRAQPARLPTIHETFCPAPGSLRRRPGTRRRCRAKQEKVEDKAERKPKEKEERIYLKSTPLSSANRAFRHGPISFERPEAGKRKGHVEDVDTTVDWTAFQMAILGGAGDLMSGFYEDDQNQMADDMVEWFETFGFETPGQLIAANDRPPLDPPHNIYSSSTSTINSDTDLPIPVQSERQLLRGGAGHGKADAATDTVRFFRSSSNADPRRYAPAREQKRHSPGGRASKRGPARPLVVGEEVPEDASEGLAERVPMGCNLEHDLDDFLRWERQCLSGGVF